MVGRRTRAVIQFGVGVAVLVLQASIWRYLRENAEQADHRIELSAPGVAAGVAERLLYLWAYDRDLGGLRTNRRRGLLSGVAIGLLRRRLLPRSDDFRFSSAVGQAAATVLYRLRYGVLGAVPDAEE